MCHICITTYKVVGYATIVTEEVVCNRVEVEGNGDRADKDCVRDFGGKLGVECEDEDEVGF